MKIKDRKYSVEKLYLVRVCEITKVESAPYLFAPINFTGKSYKKYFIAYRDKKDRKSNRYLYTIPSLYQSKIPDKVDFDTDEGDYVIREKHHFLQYFNEKKNKLSYQEILQLEHKIDVAFYEHCKNAEKSNQTENER